MQFGNWNRLKRKAAGWVGSALQLSAPAGKVFLERAAANLAQAVGLGDVFNGNDSHIRGVKLETGDMRLKKQTGNWRLDTGNLKLEA